MTEIELESSLIGVSSQKLNVSHAVNETKLDHVNSQIVDQSHATEDSTYQSPKLHRKKTI